MAPKKDGFPVRKLDRSFAATPRYWFNGNPFATRLANGLHMLFPAGERFFIRAVKRFEARIDDPKLRAEVRSFYGQEGRHGAAHERYFEELRDQGYDIDGFLAWFDEKLLQKFANTALSADMQLSITVALEHYTATLAEMALTDPIFSAIDPSMRELFYWHAVEEIEHKAVCFDVLKAVNPSYAIRIAGMVVASVGLFAVWTEATRRLAAQDRAAGLASTSRAPQEKKSRPAPVGVKRPLDIVLPLAGRFARGFVEYLKPSFHPSQRDALDRGPAETYLKQAYPTAPLATAPSPA